MRRNRGRKAVVWNSGEVIQSPASHYPHIPNEDLSSDLVEIYGRKLLVGVLWKTITKLAVDSAFANNKKYIQPPFPYLVRGLWNTNAFHIQHNSIALYLGEVRVVETTKDKNISVIRHCFLIDGRRYLTRSLNDFFPMI